MKRILLSVLIASSLISAEAAVFSYTVHFDGPSESPPNASPGVGDGTVEYNDATHFLTLQAVYTGLMGPTTDTSINAATPSPFTGVAGSAIPTVPFFPLGFTSGSYGPWSLDLSQAGNWNPTYLAANGGTPASAEAALAVAMAGGRAYWDIRTTAIPGGEVRGFMNGVPEPSTLALAGLGAILITARCWGRKGRSNKS